MKNQKNEYYKINIQKVGNKIKNVKSANDPDGCAASAEKTESSTSEMI